MKVGDLVGYSKYIGIVTCVDPEELGDLNEVEVIKSNWTRYENGCRNLQSWVNV